jgi:translation initiation factor 3 subunit F
MLALHIRANPREVVVGWYATALPFTTTTTTTPSNSNGEEEDTTTTNNSGVIITQTESKCIVDTSSLIHEFYAGECEDDPIHLVVDTGLITNSVPIHAYKSLPVIVKNETLANMFHELHCTIMSSDSERICVDRMIKSTFVEEENDDDTGGGGALATQDEGLALYQSMEKLLSMLNICSTHVDAVVDGTTPPNDTIGRNLSETLSSVPRIQPDVFDKMFNDNLQDLLMVTYLSNITKTQLLIAEKLNETLGK